MSGEASEGAFGPVRFSHLRAYGRSAMHGLMARTVDGQATYAMQRGTAVHALLFNTRKVCGYPGSQRRGKDYEAFAAEHPDTEILTMAEFDKARLMVDAVLACSLAQPYLKGTIEETMLFRWNGMDCRATPDVRGPDFLTELKSSASSAPEVFGWHALRMHYHAQMQMQIYGCPRPVGACYVVCVESKPPYPVQVYQLTDAALEAGERLLVLWSERLKGSEASGEWPPYTSCIMPLDVPDEAVALDFGEEDA